MNKNFDKNVVQQKIHSPEQIVNQQILFNINLTKNFYLPPKTFGPGTFFGLKHSLLPKLLFLIFF